MDATMPAVEFTTELSADPVLNIPREAAERLPKTGRARIVVLPLSEDATDNAQDTLEDIIHHIYVDSTLSAAERQAVLIQAGLRAGWDDPEMDVYNELDPRKQV